ncbi:unnamed protein product [Moneuplotes crassus]|uniref:Uncharacterized protein n=1 Tax=Euplotes crassus TaxID=5936 RepID=A0AAD1U402_EUPCR|nr:unnamed protein product [Moneuplotes crassus]
MFRNSHNFIPVTHSLFKESIGQVQPSSQGMGDQANICVIRNKNKAEEQKFLRDLSASGKNERNSDSVTPDKPNNCSIRSSSRKKSPSKRNSKHKKSEESKRPQQLSMNRNSEEAQSNNPGVDQTQFQNLLQNNQQYCIQVYNVVNTTKNKIIHISQTPDVQVW